MKGGKQTFRVMISLTARPAARDRPGSSLSSAGLEVNFAREGTPGRVFHNPSTASGSEEAVCCREVIPHLLAVERTEAKGFGHLFFLPRITRSFLHPSLPIDNYPCLF